MILSSMTPKGSYEWMYDSTHVMLLSNLAWKDDYYIKLAADHPECYKSLAISSEDLVADSVGLNSIYNIAREMNVNEIVLPWKFKDMYIDEQLEYLRHHNIINEFKIMVICDAKDEFDFYIKYNHLNSLPEVNCIGLPVFDWIRRDELFNIWGDSDKSIHYIGAGSSLKELIDLPMEIRYKIRSCSTHLPFCYTLRDKSIFEDFNEFLPLNKGYPKLTRTKYNAVIKEYMNYINI